MPKPTEHSRTKHIFRKQHRVKYGIWRNLVIWLVKGNRTVKSYGNGELNRWRGSVGIWVASGKRVGGG